MRVSLGFFAYGLPRSRSETEMWVHEPIRKIISGIQEGTCKGRQGRRDVNDGGYYSGKRIQCLEDPLEGYEENNYEV